MAATIDEALAPISALDAAPNFEGREVIDGIASRSLLTSIIHRKEVLEWHKITWS
jgi:hypothetical protein